MIASRTSSDDGEAELRDETCGAHHAQRVVAERVDGAARRRETTGQQVLHTARRVDEHPLGQAQRHRVDGEVAAHEVALEGVAELDDGLAGLAVVDVAAVRRDLDDLAVDAGGDGAELAADVPVRLGEGHDDLEDLVGGGVGGEVEVVDPTAEERVADGAADEGELVAGRGERGGELLDAGSGGQSVQSLDCGGDGVHDRPLCHSAPGAPGGGRLLPRAEAVRRRSRPGAPTATAWSRLPRLGMLVGRPAPAAPCL